MNLIELLLKENRRFSDRTFKETLLENGNSHILEEDFEYMELAKDPIKNKAKLSRMVEEAARKAGYDSPKLYHGTGSFGFTKVSRYLFATDSGEVAGTYSGTKTPRNISENGPNLGMYQLYANTEGMLIFDAKGSETNHLMLGDIESQFNYYQMTNSWHTYATLNQIIKYAKGNGYTGVIVNNVNDSMTSQDRKNRTLATDYVFFNPKFQVKSADIITYDDYGNIIPLSKRFNSKSNDIRESLSSKII